MAVAKTVRPNAAALTYLAASTASRPKRPAKASVNGKSGGAYIYAAPFHWMSPFPANKFRAAAMCAAESTCSPTPYAAPRSRTSAAADTAKAVRSSVKRSGRNRANLWNAACIDPPRGDFFPLAKGAPGGCRMLNFPCDSWPRRSAHSRAFHGRRSAAAKRIENAAPRSPFPTGRLSTVAQTVPLGANGRRRSLLSFFTAPAQSSFMRRNVPGIAGN